MKKCFFFRQSDKALQETNINNCEILDSNPYKDVLLNNMDIVNLTGLMVETIFFFKNEGWRQRLERCKHGNNNIENGLYNIWWEFDNGLYHTSTFISYLFLHV